MSTNTTQASATLADLTVKSGVAQASAIGDAGRSLANMGPGIASPFVTAANQLALYSMLKPVLDQYSMSKAPLGEVNDDFSLTGE